MGKTSFTDRKLFGIIALSMGMIDKEQLDECLEIQRNSDPPLQLGAIMLTNGHLSEKQVRQVLSAQRKVGDISSLPEDKTEGRKLIGEILVECCYIDPQTLKNVLHRQQLLRKTGISPRLGELLLAIGKLTRHQLEKALSVQSVFPEGQPPQASE